MIFAIYRRAFKIILKKPFLLWGISLLQILLSGVAAVLFGAVFGVSLAVSMLLGTSMTMIYLRGYRGEEINTLQLFDTFKDWATIRRVLCGMGWMALWIFLWALIPIVGPIFAIIRVYRYRLVPYILVTEPDVAPTEAIKLSEKRTQGYKGKMFLADFLYCILFFAVVLVLGLLSRIPFIGVLFGFILLLLYLCFIAFSPLFLGLVQAAFYEEISADHNCPNCGERLAANAVFCPHCGVRVGEPEAPADPVETVSPEN